MTICLRAIVLAAGIISVTFSQAASSEPVLMSADWARQACAAWNSIPELTDRLAKSGWVTNDKDRGYKVLHVYRTDCEDSPQVEMRISLQEGKARCVYGGAVEKQDLDDSVDYVMHATTKRWQEMGAGDYGPMIAMMFRRLRFDGSNWEAMKNMGPFAEFLRLTGSVASDPSSCP